ncbi:uncharacterized protein LOC17888191 [Capsella rubella]|nr:uncharacterized protein LOC17888191 [Capsella rubella]
MAQTFSIFLQHSLSFQMDQIASLGLRRSPALVSSPGPSSPPDPPEPPDPPDPLSFQIHVNVVSCSLLVFTRSSLPPCHVLLFHLTTAPRYVPFVCDSLVGPTTKYSLTPTLCPSRQIVDLCSLPLVASFGVLTPFVVSSCDTPLTAVCRFCFGLVPVSTRFDSGFLSSFPSIYMICRLDNRIVSLILWFCVPFMATLAFMNAMVVFKASMVCLPWLWCGMLCHCYSFVEFYVLSNSPFGGKRFIVGKKIFFDEARLTISCLFDMDRWSSDVFEVPLSNGFVRYCYVTFALLVKEHGLKTSLEANGVTDIVLLNGSLRLLVSWVEHVSSSLSLCLSLSYGSCLSLLYPLFVEASLF